MENDANLANYAELTAHIDRLKEKMGAMSNTSDAYAESKDDLEMYYERLHQIEQMRTNTVTIERDEHKAALEAALADNLRMRHRVALFVGVVVFAFLVVVELCFPALVSGLVASSILYVANSTPMLVALTAVCVHFMTKAKLA